MFDMSFKCNNEFDKIFTRFSKYVLGVDSKATNFAVSSDLGQFPMLISVIAKCINFGFTQSNLVMSHFCQRLTGNNVITLF